MRVQVKFAHSLLKCSWLWVGHTPLFTLRLLMFSLSLVGFLSLLLSPSTDIKIFYFCQKYHLEDIYKIFKQFHVGLTFKWGLKDQYWVSCERLHFRFSLVAHPCAPGSNLCKHAGDHSVTTEACRSPHLTCLCLCDMAAWEHDGAVCTMNVEGNWLTHLPLVLQKCVSELGQHWFR